MSEKNKNINELAHDAIVQLNHYAAYSLKINPPEPGFDAGFRAGVAFLRDSFLDAKQGGWLAYELKDEL